jgi:hypothetical protein
MGEGCELDEDVLDYCEENKLKELVHVVFEEDDDYDYLTYDITGKMTLERFASGVMDKEKVFKIIRNTALSLVNLKEQAIHLSYILLNKGFIYVNPDTLDLQFICLPVESEGSVVAEFKSFIRQLLANMKYNVDEDLAYVGQLLSYINGDHFNLRGLIGLSEALMEDAGISYEEEEGIALDDGAEVVNIAEDEPAEAAAEENVNTFMDQLGDADDVLPEIGDDEEEEEIDEEVPQQEAAKAPIRIDEDEAEPSTDGNVDEPEDAAETVVLKSEEAAPVAESTENVAPETEAPQEAAPEEEAAEQEEAVDTVTSETAESVADVKTDAVPAAVNAAPEDTVKEAAPTEAKAPETKTETAAAKPSKPETMEELKARMEQIVSGVSKPKHAAAEEAKHTAESINTLEEIDEIVANRPVIRKNTVKINRAAIIQNAVEQEQDMDIPELVTEGPDPDAEAEESKAAPAETTGRPAVSSAVPSKGVASVNNSMLGTTGTLKICPYLVRVNTNERVMITKAVFKIGKANRGVDYKVDDNGAISRQHAIIVQKDGAYYIKDNKSTNHTYVDDKRVEDGEEAALTHDCIVRLGDEEFQFKLR